MKDDTNALNLYHYNAEMSENNWLMNNVILYDVDLNQPFS